MTLRLLRLLAVLVFAVCVSAGARVAQAAQYTFFGPIAADTTWADTVTVTGDVVITPTGHLHLSAGTRVRFQARTSGYDDLDGNQFRCDIIVKGALSVEGGTAPTDSVVFTSTAQNPAGGDWGYVYFKPESRDDISSITGAAFRFGMENLYLYLSAPPIKNSAFTLAQFYGLQADSSNSTPINDCLFQQNGRYGAYMTGSSPTILGCQFLRNGANPPYTSDVGGLYMQACSGRVAQCLFQDQTALGTVALTLASASVTVAQDSFVHNTGVNLFLSGATVATVDSCTFLDGKIGVSAFAGGVVRSCYFEGMYNAAIEVVPSVTDACADKGQYAFPVIGGSLATACTFRNNNINVRDSVECAEAVQARFNDWGAVAIDSIFATFRGGVDMSPWTDPTHTQIYTTNQWGLITTNTTWTGTHVLLGDVLVMPGVTLTLQPGTRILMSAAKSNWDSLHIQDGRCDLLVQGTLLVNGGTAPGDSVVITSNADTPAAGDWGGVFVDEHASAVVIGMLSEYGVNGFLSHGSPLFLNCAARFCSNDGFKIENNGHPTVSNCEAFDCFQGLELTQGNNATGLVSCVVTSSSFHNNSLYGVNANSAGVTLLMSGCRMQDNESNGIVLNGLYATVSDCVITGNAIFGVEALSPLGVVTFGLPGHPNKIYGNAYAQAKTTPSVTAQFTAQYNYWGTVNEDQIVAGFTYLSNNYQVDYAPWSDSTGTTFYASSRYGTVTQDTTWSGTVLLNGDLTIPQGVTLTVQPGTTVKSRSRGSVRDDSDGTLQAVDIIVAGTVNVLGDPSNPVLFTSTSFAPADGEWGRIIFQDVSDDNSVVQNTTVRGARGVRCLNASPWFIGDSLGTVVDTSLVLVGQCPRGTGNGIAINTSGSSRVGVALYDNTGTFNGWRTTKGGTGIVIRGGAPTLKGISVTNAKTGIACMAGAMPLIQGCAITSNVSSSNLLVVMEGAQPRVERTLLQTTVNGGVAANGLVVRTAGTRPDLGGGPRGSAGENAFKGFDGVTRFAIVDSAAAGDTTWVASNFWGTTRGDSLDALILDGLDDPTLGTVYYQPPILDDPTPARLWALSAASSSAGADGVTLAWTGAPRTAVRLWRAAHSGAEPPAWPDDFTLLGTAVCDAQGAGRFVDATGQPGAASTYALTALGDDATPLALFSVEAPPVRLSLDVVGGLERAPLRRLRLSLPAAGPVTLEAFAASGRRVSRLWDGPLPAGVRTLGWDTASLPAGIYWLRLRAAADTRSTRVLVMR